MIKVLRHTRWLTVSLGIGLTAGACDRTGGAAAREAERAATTAAENSQRQADQANDALRVATETARVAEQARAVEQTRAEEAGREAERARTVPMTMAFTEALGNIATSRCEREQRCGHVGVSQRHPTLHACQASVRSSYSNDLNASDCPGGINRAELAECVAEVRNEDCNNPLDTLGRLAACRAADICRATTISAR